MKARTPCPICAKPAARAGRLYCGRSCYEEKARRFPNSGAFKKGQPAGNRLPVGTERVRIRKTKDTLPRVWVKIAEPNVWRPRAVVVWESLHGPTPPDHIIHHKDRDSLNDSPTNLAALTRAEHALEHVND